MNELPPGRYRHYKGNEYTVLGTAVKSWRDRRAGFCSRRGTPP